MSALRNLVDKLKPTFTKGGKLGFLESTFDAFETFLFVPDTTTSKGAHIRDCNDMKRTMIMVVVALMPALLFGFYNTGYMHFLSQGVQPEFWASLWFGFLKVLPLIVVSYVVGLGIEFAFAQFRGHEVNEGFLVSGLLIPMIMPVDIPLWMVALSTAFAVVFGKEVFGGTGMNVFNPALLARALRLLRLYALDVGRDGVDRGHDLRRGRGGRLLRRNGARKPEHHGPDGLFGHGRLPRFHSGLRGRDFDAGDPDRRGDPALYGRRFVAHDGLGIRRRSGDGLSLPSARRDDLSGMVAPDRRRFRFRCGLHGHRSRHLGADRPRANTSWV